ncbi:MAG: polyhydroxyalkanoate depolymerase, partial [Pseudomonadota bacterium]
MLYHWYELSHALVRPARLTANALRHFYRHPFNVMSYTPAGKHISAACEVFERTTRRYEKPSFGIQSTRIDDREVPVREEVVWQKPFCRLIRFARDDDAAIYRDDPKILLVAPMSGHYATLLRGTVERLLPDHDVYITDWQDARDVPMTYGRFDLNDYVDYVISILRALKGDVHVFAVCQPSVPVLAAAA